MAKQCAAEVELRRGDVVVMTLPCSLTWPHLNEQHTCLIQWPVDPDDLVLAATELDVAEAIDIGLGENVLEVPHVVVDIDETGPRRDE